MASTGRIFKPIDTIWECPDDLWDRLILPVIEALDPPAATGRKRVDLRPALNGIICLVRIRPHRPRLEGRADARAGTGIFRDRAGFNIR